MTFLLFLMVDHHDVLLFQVDPHQGLHLTDGGVGFDPILPQQESVLLSQLVDPPRFFEVLLETKVIQSP